MLVIFYSTVTADLKLLPSAGSDRAWVWNPQADYADEEPKPEQLAIRFANAESEYTCVCTYGRSHKSLCCIVIRKRYKYNCCLMITSQKT